MGAIRRSKWYTVVWFGAYAVLSPFAILGAWGLARESHLGPIGTGVFVAVGVLLATSVFTTSVRVIWQTFRQSPPQNRPARD